MLEQMQSATCSTPTESISATRGLLSEEAWAAHSLLCTACHAPLWTMVRRETWIVDKPEAKLAVEIHSQLEPLTDADRRGGPAWRRAIAQAWAVRQLKAAQKAGRTAAQLAEQLWQEARSSFVALARHEELAVVPQRGTQSGSQPASAAAGPQGSPSAAAASAAAGQATAPQAAALSAAGTPQRSSAQSPAAPPQSTEITAAEPSVREAGTAVSSSQLTGGMPSPRAGELTPENVDHYLERAGFGDAFKRNVASFSGDFQVMRMETDVLASRVCPPVAPGADACIMLLCRLLLALHPATRCTAFCSLCT